MEAQERLYKLTEGELYELLNKAMMGMRDKKLFKTVQEWIDELPIAINTTTIAAVDLFVSRLATKNTIDGGAVFNKADYVKLCEAILDLSLAPTVLNSEANAEVCDATGDE